MKRHFLLFAIALLVVAMIAGCGKTPNIETNATDAPATEAAVNTTEASIVEPTTQATEAPVVETTEATEAPTEGESDLYTYYTDVVYAEQIGRYHTALYQQWDIDMYFENDMSTLPLYYYEGNPLENVGFGFVDLDNDGNLELVIGAIWNAKLDPAVIEIWTLVDGEPVMLAQGGTENRYILHCAQENTWHIINEASNNVANRATYDLILKEGKLEVVQGVVFDAIANETDPWFKTWDLDWDISNDEPIDAVTADTIQSSYREYYTALDYLPYTSYHSDQPLPPQTTPQQRVYERAAELSQRFGVDIRIPEQDELWYSHYDAYALTDWTFANSTLDVLEENLSLYPEGFISQLAYGSIQTIRFELVGGLAVKAGVDIDANSTEAFAQNLGDYYLVVLNAYFADAQGLFHEISHLTDARLVWDALNREGALFSEQAWLDLQPEGFYYAMSYTNVPEELLGFADSDYFGHWYALTFPTEDRAMLMEAAMLNNARNFEPGSGRREKFRYYADCIRDSFDTTGWPEITLWEQVLQ